MIISYVIGMSGVSWPIAGSVVGMETVGVVRLLMIRRTIYCLYADYSCRIGCAGCGGSGARVDAPGKEPIG